MALSVVLAIEEKDGGNKELAAELLKQEVLAKPIKTGIQVKLRESDGVYIVPKAIVLLKLKIARIQIEAKECWENGQAIVICGIGGQKLQPFYIATAESQRAKEGVSAMFSNFSRCVTITVSPNGLVTITRHVINESAGNCIALVGHELFKGQLSNLPPGSLFQAAAEAAVKMALSTEHSSGPYYAEYTRK